MSFAQQSWATPVANSHQRAPPPAAPARPVYDEAVPSPRLFLIDSFGFIFRAYHARARSAAPPMRTAGGLSTEVAFIFQTMLRRLQRDWQPAYLAAVFESEEPTHRTAAYAEYKANRPSMPDDLRSQVQPLLDAVVALGLPPAQQAVVVAFAALPTAASAYVLAVRMGGNGQYVAGLITVSTVIGMAGLPLALAALQAVAR